MQRWPHLGGTFLELSEVIVHAEPILTGYGDFIRITFETGDIVQGPAAGRHDRAVLQVMDRDTARSAIRHAADSLPPAASC
jgi:hypothetical protein